MIHRDVERAATLSRLGHALAAELGAAVSNDPVDGEYRHRVDLTDRDGRVFMLRWLKNDDRVEVSGVFPHHASVRVPDRPSITVAASRTAKALAREVTRRFLPPFVAAWDEYHQRIAEWEAADVEAGDVAASLARALGTQVVGREGAHERVVYGPSCTFHVGNSWISMDARGITPATAEALAQVLAQAAADKTVEAVA